jgi:DNA-directed RNA polymerase subunit alpha
MTKLTCIENYIDKEFNHYGCFLIEPLELGQAITLGNSLRRTLLSDLSGFAITGARINNIKHEFTVIESLREDILEVLLNLKEIIFKESFFSKELLKKTEFQAYLNTKGPIIVTAGMFKLPKNTLRILNPNHYICTILDEAEFYCDIDIKAGKGYQIIDDIRRKNVIEKLAPTRPSTLLLDANFMPVKKVNFKVKLINDTQGNIKESLILEVTTNGSITPKRALQEALKLLINLLYPLIIDSDFLKASSELAKNFQI